MALKGSTGTSMGSIIKKPQSIDPNKKHCNNCKFFVKGICEKLNEQTKGKIKRLTNKNDAKNCAYFIKKSNDESNSKRPNQKRNFKKYKKRTTNTN